MQGNFVSALDVERNSCYHLLLSIHPSSLETQELNMFFSVAVLCAFVVKSLSIAPLMLHPSLVAFLHGSCTAPARKSSTSCFTGARSSRDVRHQYGAFSTLCAAPISVSRSPQHDMHIFDVNKCQPLYRQLPSSTLWHPTKNASNVGKCGGFLDNRALLLCWQPAEPILRPLLIPVCGAKLL
jgi:hypothetical protein